MTGTKMVCGMFLECDQMNRAINNLRSGGFQLENITLLAPSHYGSHDFAYKLKMSVSKGAFIGAAVGIAIFGLLGFLIGDGSVQLIGLESPTSGLRTFFLTLAGMVTGAFLGAACGSLVGIGTPETAEKRYVFYLQEGSFVLSVHVRDATEEKHAREILEHTGGHDISALPDNALNIAA